MDHSPRCHEVRSAGACRPRGGLRPRPARCAGGRKRVARRSRATNVSLVLGSRRSINGLVPDRWPSKSFCSIAAVGFALNAYAIGAERGWISRAQARERTLNTLRFFASAPQGTAANGMTGYRGFFYHFIDMERGSRFETTELSSIDTVLLLAGILFAGGYYDGADRSEAEIRHLAGLINGRVDWPWMLGKGPLVSMGWTPEQGFIESQWDRFNEATMLYLLAIGSPTHPIDPAIWTRWTANFSLQLGRPLGRASPRLPAAVRSPVQPPMGRFQGDPRSLVARA